MLTVTRADRAFLYNLQPFKGPERSKLCMSHSFSRLIILKITCTVGWAANSKHWRAIWAFTWVAFAESHGNPWRLVCAKEGLEPLTLETLDVRVLKLYFFYWFMFCRLEEVWVFNSSSNHFEDFPTKLNGVFACYGTKGAPLPQRETSDQ